ncbi:MAG: type II toxin-antitoxin system HicA family toxin [Solibacteraceae bacterium]|nr:type II toxin-antitoxin system HicA family toxin [Solibacteraceae bacterium]
MKRQELIRKLEQSGCVVVRHGGSHDWYRNPKTGWAQAVPRHREINERLALHILKKLQGQTGL